MTSTNSPRRWKIDVRKSREMLAHSAYDSIAIGPETNGRVEVVEASALEAAEARIKELEKRIKQAHNQFDYANKEMF